MNKQEKEQIHLDKKITETEVRNAITKYGKKTNLTRDEIKTKILEKKTVS